MIDFARKGLGLQYGTVHLVRTQAQWPALADDLAADIRSALGGAIQAVAHVGSTAVPGLLAKPILDLAVGVHRATGVDQIADAMSTLGWIYRGDAGNDGGWVFVMEDSPCKRRIQIAPAASMTSNTNSPVARARAGSGRGQG